MITQRQLVEALKTKPLLATSWVGELATISEFNKIERDIYWKIRALTRTDRGIEQSVYNSLSPVSTSFLHYLDTWKYEGKDWPLPEDTSW